MIPKIKIKTNISIFLIEVRLKIKSNIFKSMKMTTKAITPTITSYIIMSGKFNMKSSMGPPLSINMVNSAININVA